MYLKETLSIVYHDLLEGLIQLEVAQEDWLDCSDCHTCSNSNLKRFHTKCCDYQPSLPNFIVGSILNDSSKALSIGKNLIQKRIKNKLGVTPYGILPSNSNSKALEC